MGDPTTNISMIFWMIIGFGFGVLVMATIIAIVKLVLNQNDRRMNRRYGPRDRSAHFVSKSRL